MQSMCTLHIYMDGRLKLKGGDDLNNTGWSGALRIYTTTKETCTVGNKSQLYAWFQAPNAKLEATGGNDTSMMCGFPLAKTITGSGSMDFHYDDSLQPAGSGNGWTVGSWMEFQSSTDRAAVGSLTGNFIQ